MDKKTRHEAGDRSVPIDDRVERTTMLLACALDGATRAALGKAVRALERSREGLAAAKGSLEIT